jgi:hypothetical protein
MFNKSNFILFHRNLKLSNYTDELKNKLYSSGNLYCSFRDKKVTIEDVIKGRQGLLKMVYDYCIEQGLEPKLYPDTDGGGMHEGFKLYITW